MLDQPALLGVLIRTDILRELPLERVRLFAGLGHAVELPGDTILGVQDGHSQHLYVILQGTVQLSAPTAVGYLALRIAGPGETIPLSALVGDGTLVSTAVAIGNVLAFQVPVTAVQRLCEEYPDVGASLYRQIAAILGGRYRKTVDYLAEGLASEKSLTAISSLFTS